jgi:hypothetical protein
MITFFKKTLLTILFLSSTLFTQKIVVSKASKIGHKVTHYLQNEYKNMFAKETSKETLVKELTDLQNTVAYVSGSIATQNKSNQNLYVAAGSSAVWLSTLFAITVQNNKGVAFIGSDIKFNNFIVSLTTLAAVISTGLTVIHLKNYYITKLLIQDLTEEEQAEIVQELRILQRNIFLNLEQLNLE